MTAAGPGLLEEFKKKKLRALSRLISLAENQDESVGPVFSSLYSTLGHARVLGMTGPPGAGKSTLTSQFIRLARAQKKTVAVLAVDPVSPFSGGALLGDRIRLVDHFNDPGVFIRSLSTRGRLGGLSLATREAVHALDAFGFDYIVVETVGVGQSEVDIRKIADVILVVLVPEWGDGIQTIKAGVLEIGDLFVVNKSDREGAERLHSELVSMCQIAQREATPVLLSSQEDPTSVEALWNRIEKHFKDNEALLLKKRKTFAKETASELMERWVLAEAKAWVENHAKEDANPYEFFLSFRRSHPPGSLFTS